MQDGRHDQRQLDNNDDNAGRVTTTTTTTTPGEPDGDRDCVPINRQTHEPQSASARTPSQVRAGRHLYNSTSSSSDQNDEQTKREGQPGQYYRQDREPTASNRIGTYSHKDREPTATRIETYSQQHDDRDKPTSATSSTPPSDSARMGGTLCTSTCEEQRGSASGQLSGDCVEEVETDNHRPAA